MTPPSDIPDLLDITVPVGGRVVVVADLHLSKEPSPAQLAASGELAASIEAASGPGVLIVAGNLLDGDIDPKPALAAHARLTRAISRFAAGPGRRVVVLPGNRDVRLASSEPARKAVQSVLGAELALAAELSVATGAGERRVRVEPGYRFDPLDDFQDPRNPLESPFGAHIRREVLPSFRRRAARADRPPAHHRLHLPHRSARPDGAAPAAATEEGRLRTGWLNGVEQLDDLGALSRFIVSRLVYRRLAHSGWLILIPVVAAFVLRVPATALRSARAGGLTTRLGLFVAASFVELAVLVLLALLAIRVTTRTMGAVALEDPGRDPNDGPRAAARELVTGGHAGLITGHTCRPEMTALGTGFYINAGSGADVVTEYPSRVPGLGLPSVFMAHRMLSWVELEAGNDLHARLLHARQDLPGASLLERLVADRPVPSCSGELRPAVVATFPHGDKWPQLPSTEKRDRRIRRLAAALMVSVGFLSLVSAMSDPLRDRLDVIRQLFPLAVPQTAAAVTALFGVAMIVLARSVRRGQRRAWFVCQILLLAAAALHVIKGVDVEESLVALGVAGVLYIYRDSFQARTDVLALRRGLTTVLGATALVVAAGTVSVEISTMINHTRHHVEPRVSWWHALEASLSRMVGSNAVALPHRINTFLAPTMFTATVGLVLALLAVLFRPVVARRRAPATTMSAGPAERAVPAVAAGPRVPATAPGPDASRVANGDVAVARSGPGRGDDAGAVPAAAGPAGAMPAAVVGNGAAADGGAARGGATGSSATKGSAARNGGARSSAADGSPTGGTGGSGGGANGSGEALVRARGVLERHGSGTLDYFALRPDKDFFFWGDTVVAHAVYGTVCLVSPDPIGPVAERDEAWRAFRRYVDANGWALGGLGIGEDWLPIYRSSGMHDLYVGDEAVVRVDRFTLDGGRFKGLRQAVNRIAKYGYRISFHDPAHLDPDLQESLREVMTKSRRGDVERGFSMTLGRVFDPSDRGLLLAVVHGPADPGAPEGTLGPPVAFCQYVPAPGIGGYSLDLMRRDDGEHPNGLIDFAVVETIKELKARGMKGLGLNFATMRAVLAGEAGEGVSQRVQAWLLRRMGDSMQIESLWKFNAKFDPDWQPRYAIYDAPENTLAVAIAVARAESFWELPVIGRFLVPSAAREPEQAPAQ